MSNLLKRPFDPFERSTQDTKVAREVTDHRCIREPYHVMSITICCKLMSSDSPAHVRDPLSSRCQENKPQDINFHMWLFNLTLKQLTLNIREQFNRNLHNSSFLNTEYFKANESIIRIRSNIYKENHLLNRRSIFLVI